MTFATLSAVGSKLHTLISGSLGLQLGQCNPVDQRVHWQAAGSAPNQESQEDQLSPTANSRD